MYTKTPCSRQRIRGFFCGRTNLINNKFCFRSYNCFKDVARHGEAKAYLFFKIYIINRSKTQEIDLCSVSRHPLGWLCYSRLTLRSELCNQRGKVFCLNFFLSGALKNHRFFNLLRPLGIYIERSLSLSCDLSSFWCLN